jgi:hypothetical protein
MLCLRTTSCRVTVAVMAATLIAATALVGGLSRAEQSVHPDPKILMLRLPDLPPGYAVADTDCGLVLAGEGASPALTTLFARYPHRGCSTDLDRAWTRAGTPKGPPRVRSSAVVFDTAAGADAELRLGPDVIAYLIGVARNSLVPVPASIILGDATAVYRTDDTAAATSPGRPGFAVLWRSGRVLAMVLVAGLTPDAGEREALRLAAVQQERIASPTQLKPRDYDDSAVVLDDPGLGVDAYWLGRRFMPGGTLPPLALKRGQGPIGSDEGPGWRAGLEYGPPRDFGTDVTLGLWKARVWARFVRTRFGRLVWHERCARAERIALPGGHAVLYAGFTTPQRRCDGSREPDYFLAHVYLRRVVVSVNIPICWSCRDGFGPYNSLAGMRRVVRALHRRSQLSGTP